MAIKLIKRKDQNERKREKPERPKVPDPENGAKRWVEEFKARKQAERARALELLAQTLA
ncbi:MAG TPA: hypothetical protein VKM94_24350 [Blastocatellia bacterium]|nr:hypothetical protein [Blastocatellia bacterium]